MKADRTVFVVDDESVICNTLVAILSHAGYSVTAFEDPKLAIKAAAEMAPDLLITDVMMPGMNGIELAIHFQNFHPKCKVLLFSGQAATADLLIDARLRGYNFDLLGKPVHPTDLIARLEAL